MSEPCREELMADFTDHVNTECAEHYLKEFGRLPTPQEQEWFFDEYMEGDLRIGEE